MTEKYENGMTQNNHKGCPAPKIQTFFTDLGTCGICYIFCISTFDKFADISKWNSSVYFWWITSFIIRVPHHNTNNLLLGCSSRTSWLVPQKKLRDTVLFMMNKHIRLRGIWYVISMRTFSYLTQFAESRIAEFNSKI